MSKNHCSTALILAGMALAGTLAHAAPSDPKKWSRVENPTTRSYTITNVDATGKSTIGTLWCKRSDEAGNGKGLTKKGDSYILAPGSHLFYFDTTATRIGMHLMIQEAQSTKSIGLHVTNLDPTVTGTEIQVFGSPLNNCGIIIDPTGYRNLEGGPLFTLKDVGGASTKGGKKDASDE